MPMLIDNHGRPINYVRLAVTDRCNLRCFYCMPEEGIDYQPKSALLSYEEMLRLVRLLAPMGVDKVRITGGEPFLRKDLLQLLRGIADTPGIKTLNITTNGTLTAPFIPELKALGIKSVNLSLDTLDPERFYRITRRDEFDKVWHTFESLLAHDIDVKINAVVMAGQNEADILPLAALTQDYPVSVRFIEEMPFNGVGKAETTSYWDRIRLTEHLQQAYPLLERLPQMPHATAENFRIPGHQGVVGIIAAYSRTFCGTCNRLRVTPQGGLKTCLYDAGVFNLRDLMREGATDSELQTAIQEAVAHRAKNGFEAEQRRAHLPISESMTTIGG